MFPFLGSKISPKLGQDRDEVTDHGEHRKKGPSSAVGRNWPSLVTVLRLEPIPEPEHRSQSYL